MTTLRKLRGWLVALSERTKIEIVPLVAVMVVVPTLVLVGAARFILSAGGPSVSGTTPDAQQAADRILEDERAPAVIRSVSCAENTDDWASTGFARYRCTVVAQSGTLLCDAGETLSEGFVLDCDDASHYEAVRSLSLARAQSALDAISRDGYWSAYVSELMGGATAGFRALCAVGLRLDGGSLGEAITVDVYAPMSSSGAGLGTVLTVSPTGVIQGAGYGGADIGAWHAPGSRDEFGVGVCEPSDAGLKLTAVLIRPETTAAVASADGTPAPPEQGVADTPGDDEPAATVPTPGALTETGEQAASSALMSYFQTPSGNIICGDWGFPPAYVPGRLECTVVSAGRTWSLTPDGAYAGPIGPDVRATADLNIETLGYGRTWEFDGYTCLSQESGLTCRNGVGNGFLLSRESQRIFGPSSSSSPGSSSMPTVAAGWAFVTPSGNIACRYRGDGQSVGEIWCYVRSRRTLAMVNESGAGRDAYVRQGVRQPSDIARLRGPILEYGATWKSPFGGVVRCVSRITGLTCTNGVGDDTGFVASRDEVRTLR